MLIQRTQPTAVHTLSARFDEEAYSNVKTLADNLSTSPSVILRVAIFNLLEKAKASRKQSISELICNA
jgi:predicted transcriptional regulator